VRLFGVSAYDPGIYAVVGLATAVAATLACAVPRLLGVDRGSWSSAADGMSRSDVKTACLFNIERGTVERSRILPVQSVS
jgi:hypothetical protein